MFISIFFASCTYGALVGARLWPPCTVASNSRDNKYGVGLQIHVAIAMRTCSHTHTHARPRDLFDWFSSSGLNTSAKRTRKSTTDSSKRKIDNVVHVPEGRGAPLCLVTPPPADPPDLVSICPHHIAVNTFKAQRDKIDVSPQP